MDVMFSQRLVSEVTFKYNCNQRGYNHAQYFSAILLPPHHSEITPV